MEHYLILIEAAKVMRLTPGGLRNRIYRGKPEDIPPYIIDGRRFLFPASLLEKWMASRLHKPKRRPGRPTKSEVIERERSDFEEAQDSVAEEEKLKAESLSENNAVAPSKTSERGCVMSKK